MDSKIKYDVVDRFLDEMSKYGKSEVVCPICKTKLSYRGNMNAYEVRCQTDNCLKEEFRGI